MIAENATGLRNLFTLSSLASYEGQLGKWPRMDAELIEEPKAIKGSTRIEAQRRRRAELREKGRVRQHIVSQAEFLARRGRP